MNRLLRGRKAKFTWAYTNFDFFKIITNKATNSVDPNSQKKLVWAKKEEYETGQLKINASELEAKKKRAEHFSLKRNAPAITTTTIATIFRQIKLNNLIWLQFGAS